MLNIFFFWGGGGGVHEISYIDSSLSGVGEGKSSGHIDDARNPIVLGRKRNDLYSRDCPQLNERKALRSITCESDSAP